MQNEKTSDAPCEAPNLTVDIDTTTEDIRKQLIDLYNKIGIITKYFDVSIPIVEKNVFEDSNSFLRKHLNLLSDISDDLGIIITQVYNVETQIK